LRRLRDLIDPNTAPLRAPPDSPRDLYVMAINGWVVALDNVSTLSADVADSMCRLSTGGGFSTRALYTNDEEVLFDGQRPISLNSIADAAVRSDLLDRTIGVQLEVIPDTDRKLESDLWNEFEAAQPRLLGALYDAVAHGLQNLPDTRPNRLPRMADFARWAMACETAYDKAGAFMAAYDEYREDAVGIVLDGDLVADALRRFMETFTGQIETTAKELLESLDGLVTEQARKSKLWPSTPRGLGGRLRALAPALRKVGVILEWPKREPGTGRRSIILSHAERVGS
jgi:hypothetical protein